MPPRPHRRPTATVLVLGDLGRSPRMLYHAQSLAEECESVHLVGYRESALPAFVLDAAPITVHGLPDAPRWLRAPPAGLRLLFLPFAAARAAFVAVALLVTLLFRVGRTDAVLVQSPPALPSLLVARFACWVMGSRLVIDWHNFGFTLLELKLGGNAVRFLFYFCFCFVLFFFVFFVFFLGGRGIS
jgi:beta-1,4-mannosyltransferase